MDIQGLRDKILQLAIQGKLVEQDENDEPASALVQRIKEERDKLVREKKIKKPKKLLPIEEEEKPFEIPDGWEWVRLGEVAQFINGDRGKNYPSKNELVESGIPFINAGHLNNSEIELDNMNYITDEKFESLSSGKIQIKDIIYCLRGTLGKCSINKKIEKGAIASSLVIIRSYIDIYEKYLYYYLVSPLAKYMIKKYDNGTAQPNLSAESVRQYSLPLPPFVEQKRIVEKVDELFALIDELDSNKEDLLEVINLTRNQVLQQAIQGKLVEQNPEDEPVSVLLDRIKGERDKLVKEKKIRKPKKLPPIEEEEKPFEIPEGWEWVRLGEVLNIRRGASPRPIKKYLTDDENGINWIKIGDATDSSKYITSVNEKIIPDGAKKSVYLKSGTLVMSNSMSFGKAYILGVDGCIHDGWLAFEFNKDYLETELLQIFLKASYDRFDRLAVGTGVRNLNIDRVRATVIPLPPFAEQKRIVEKIDIIMDMLDKLERTIK